jgi:ATP-binding cassette, subfamily F, member 3
VESLTQSLESYPGTLVVVSHDRGFIRRVGKNILEVNHGKVRRYLGTYDEYVWSLQKGAFAAEEPEEPVDVRKPVKAADAPPKNLDREQTKVLQRDLKKCAKTLEDLDAKLQKLNARLTVLTDEMAQQNVPRSGIYDEVGAVQREIEETEAQWLEATEQKESIEKQLS